MQGVVAPGVGVPVDQGARALTCRLRNDAADAALGQVMAAAGAVVGHQPERALARPS